MTDQPRKPDADPDDVAHKDGPDPMDDVEGGEGLPELPDESSTLEDPADDADSVEHIEKDGEPFGGNFA